MDLLLPAVCISFLLFALAKLAYGAGENFGEQFIGSPLLVLVAVMVIAALASLFHKIRK